MLSAEELTKRRNRVLGAINTLSPADALAVMSAAMCELSERDSGHHLKAANDTARPSAEEIVGRRSRLKVERDPEIRDFIHSLRGCNSVDEIVEACQKRFGPRAPGRTAVYRYFQRLKFRRGIRGER